MNVLKSYFLAICLASGCLKTYAAEQFVSFVKSEQGICLTQLKGQIITDKNEFEGVRIAVDNLKNDLTQVCGRNDLSIIVGTLPQSALVKKNLPENLRSELEGKTEKFIITVVGKGKKQSLLIAGSDMRGTIYGIYELSKQIGVSPWYWWADVPVEKHSDLYITPGVYSDGEPAVRYRGIFLNDEAPCLTSWVKNTYGTDFGGHEFYARTFELLLRLKANFMWPAMWGWSFYADDPLNIKTANTMGIIMGTSHHEPMARNHQEYARDRQKWGAWDYVTNKEKLDLFFREGMERAKETEDLITIGMRGDGDTSMGGREGHDDEGGSEDERVMKILKDVIDNQRKIISEVTGRPAEERPQVWALYKEVQKYYDKGLRVPDDVTILLSDDNWGDVKSMPNSEERKHKGGWGIYYHVDYVGAPRNSKWLNITPAANMWEQLQLTYSYGVDKIWVLNVGDLKPMEFPISMFLDMAWKPSSVSTITKKNNIGNVSIMPYMEKWCTQQFGAEEAKEAAQILNLYTWYNGRVTPEMLDARTYDVASGEWKAVRDEYARLADRAKKQYERIDKRYRDAYYQILYYPVCAMANLYDMYYSAATGDAKNVETTFAHDQELSDYYNNVMAGGKWKGMMTQKHIGYRSWNDNFPKDVAPRVMQPRPADETAVSKAVVIEAEHFDKAESKGEQTWTVIPYIGRTLSGVSVMPYTDDPKEAKLSYVIRNDSLTDGKDVTVYVITKSTLAFKNKKGHCFNIGFEGGERQTININRDLNEDHPYDKLYPAAASRIIENRAKLKVDGKRSDGNSLTLTIQPLDPGIVFEKIIIDYGHFRKTFLYGKEN